MHIHRIEKKDTEEFTYMPAMEKKTNIIDFGHVERVRESEIYGKSNMEIYITICKIANGNLLCVSGNSNRGSVSA